MSKTALAKSDPLHIMGLEIRDFKRIAAIDLDLGGRPVVISGDNAMGKSSILDAILWGLTGKGTGVPIRTGAGKTRVKIGIGSEAVEYYIERKATTASGNIGSMIVTNAKDKAAVPSAQTFVNNLVASHALDPLSIFDMTKTSEGNRKLVAMLLEVLGLSGKMTELDDAIAKDSEERKGVNRDAKSLDARLDALPAAPAGTPDKPVDVAALSAEQQKLWDIITEHNVAKLTANNAATALANSTKRVAELKKELAAAEKKEKESKEASTKANADVDSTGQLAEGAQTNIDAVKLKLDNANKINAAVGAKQDRANLTKEVAAKMKEADALTQRIEKARESKIDLVKKAKLPVEGLQFSEDLMTLEGVPLGDLNTATRIKVCCALAMAEKPDLRLLFVRELALCNEETIKAIADFATENGYQMLAEYFSPDPVETDDLPSIHIIEGEVVS